MSRAARLGSALGLFVATLVLLLATTSELGYARDEGFYFMSARAYEPWFELLWDKRGVAFQQKHVDAAWVMNHEHPGLMKSLFALSHRVLHQRWGMFAEPGTSFRFPAMVLSAAMISVVFLWASKRMGAAFGMLAALSLLFMPRVFYHAHLACFDVPITFWFVAVFYAYQRSRESSHWAWPIFTGLFYGAALATKHNAWFLPVALLLHAALMSLEARLRGERVRPRLTRSLRAFGAMSVLGPVVFLVTWPWLWFDTKKRFLEYADFHLNHVFYNMEFLGETYFEPPFPRTYAPLMFIATVSLVTIVCAALGAFQVLRRGVTVVRRRRAAPSDDDFESALLWLLGAGLSFGPWVFADTPIFGGTKHWMPAYPFVALLGALGAARAARSLAGAVPHRLRLAWGARRLRAGIAWTLGVVLVLPPARCALAAHPWGLSAYTPVVGGAQGAASLGLNRTFWGYTTPSVMDDVARRRPGGAAIYPHDTARASWDMLIEDGRVGRSYRAVWNVENADFAVYHHEQHMRVEEFQIWIAYGTRRPLAVEGLHGVPVVLVYEKPLTVR